MDDRRKIKKQCPPGLTETIVVLLIAILIFLFATPMPISAQRIPSAPTDTAPDLKFEHFTDEGGVLLVVPLFVLSGARVLELAYIPYILHRSITQIELSKKRAVDHIQRSFFAGSRLHPSKG